MESPFLRNEMLWGEAAQQTLAEAHVILFGLGGVGSYTAEALVRAGVGELTLVDNDSVGITNLNRQLEALHSTLGTAKADAVAARAKDIHPELRVHPLCATYDAAHRELFFPEGCHYDYIVDAIDLVSCKLDLIETAQRLHLPIFSALGTGNKLDPTRLQLADIAETSGCPLARVMRRELRRRGIQHLPVVFSPEEPAAGVPFTAETPPPGRRSVPASNPWVPATAGLLLAFGVVRDLLARRGIDTTATEREGTLC
ncbi:MAG: ThiF family adenylyltransferase [Oscillospiraceae bacterium]